MSWNHPFSSSLLTVNELVVCKYSSWIAQCWNCAVSFVFPTHDLMTFTDFPSLNLFIWADYKSSIVVHMCVNKFTSHWCVLKPSVFTALEELLLCRGTTVARINSLSVLPLVCQRSHWAGRVVYVSRHTSFTVWAPGSQTDRQRADERKEGWRRRRAWRWGGSGRDVSRLTTRSCALIKVLSL